MSKIKAMTELMQVIKTQDQLLIAQNNEIERLNQRISNLKHKHTICQSKLKIQQELIKELQSTPIEHFKPTTMWV